MRRPRSSNLLASISDDELSPAGPGRTRGDDRLAPKLVQSRPLARRASSRPLKTRSLRRVRVPRRAPVVRLECAIEETP